MATQDWSPSMFAGQSWSAWADNVPLTNENDDDDVISSRNEEESSEDSMKLRKKDLSLFGFCPSQDELFLVLCEKCNKSIKPQAFKQHMVKRHGVKDSHARRSSSTSHSSHSSSKYISPKKEEKRSSSSSQAPLTCPVPTKASVKQTPPNIAALARARQNARDKSESSAPVKEKGEKLDDSATSIKVKKSQTLPIVKVERITEQLPSKKPLAISLDSDTLTSDINISIKTEIELDEKPDIFMPELQAELEKVPEKPPVLHPIKPIIPKLTKSFSTTTPSSTPISKVLSSMSSKSTSSGSSKILSGASTLSSKTISGVSSSKLGSVSSSKLLSSNVLSSSSKSSSGASPLSIKSSSGASQLSSKSNVSTAANVTSTTSVVTIKSDKPDFSHTVTTNVLNKPFSSVSMAPKPTSLSITSNTTKSSSSTKLVKPFKEKFLPCKDREYDSSKHCGVFIEDIQKSCTRSLTCKTHALSLRRAVKGRIKPFDDLLKEHRIAKEALLKAKALAAGLPPPTSKYSYLLEASEAEAAAAAATAASSGANSSHSKPNQSSSITSPHRSSKPHNKLSGPAFQRISVSGVCAPQTSISEDSNTLAYGQSEVLEEELDCRETHFINRHPRPAAICTFGARMMSGARYSVFNHRPDFMRAAFISAIERHLHPPPHKKLCVESNLPKDSHVVTNAVDPYEFMDPGLAGSAAHSFNSMFNSQMRTSSMKQKSKQTVNKTSKQVLGSRSPGSINSLPTVTNMNPAKRKRNISSQGGNPSPVISQNFTNVIQSLPLNTNNNINNNSNPIATIAIPGMNITGTTIGQFNTTAGKTGQLQLQKNNIINKDGQVNFVLTGIDPSLTRNGCVSIATSQFGQMITTDDKNSKKSRTSVAGTKSNNKLVNTIEGIKTFPNNVFTIPQNAVYMDGGLQGTLLQMPNLTPTSNNTIMSLATPVVTTQQLQDSSLTNGVHSSDKVVGNRQKFVQTGPKSITTQGVPLLQTSGHPGQLFTSQTQLNPIQVKSSNINMNKKVAMQPVSVTIPLLSQSNFSALGGPQTQHTFLLRTSTDDNGQRQEIHLQQPLSNSSTNLIS